MCAGSPSRAARTPPTTALRVLMVAAGGAGLGLLAARYLLVGSGLSLIFWAAAAIAVGWTACTATRAVGEGVVFGFALAAGFMIFGYDGAEPLPTRLPAFALLGLLGAGCAGALALLGRALAGSRTSGHRRRERRPR